MHASWEIAALLLVLAVLLDWFAREYPNAIHPVVWIGWAVKTLLRLAPTAGWWAQFFFGMLLVAVLCGLTGAAAVLAMMLAREHIAAQIIVGTFLLKGSFALHELGRAAYRVTDPIKRNDLPAAREALRSLCSRDPTQLEARELLAGTVESLAENASDSFVAPLFYYLLFGVAGALVYRAINTMDAMIGYRGKYEALGKAAARLDDAANWVPARLTAWLLLLAGWLCGQSFRDGWRILRRDGCKTASPNAGKPMAAVAGLLGVQLEKKDAYVLGDPCHELTCDTVRQTWTIVVIASGIWLAALLLVTMGGARWYEHI